MKKSIPVLLILAMAGCHSSPPAHNSPIVTVVVPPEPDASIMKDPIPLKTIRPKKN